MTLVQDQKSKFLLLYDHFCGTTTLFTSRISMPERQSFVNYFQEKSDLSDIIIWIMFKHLKDPDHPLQLSLVLFIDLSEFDA